MGEYTDKQMARAARVLKRAEAWRKLNPEAWAFVVALALRLADAGEPISGRALVEAVRRKAFVDREGHDALVNNDYAAVFARWLWIDHPGTRPFIKQRRTPFNILLAA